MVDIYLAGLLEAARKTQVGGTWILYRTKVIVDLRITDRRFDELQPLIEARMPGKWRRTAASNRERHEYIRLS